MNSWDDLPNAKHIDRIVRSMNMDPVVWNDVWPKVECLITSDIGDNAWAEASRQEFVEIRNYIYQFAPDPGWLGAEYSVLALCAWDGCAYMLDSDPDELTVLAKLGDHRAIMLLPACIAFAKEKELT